MGAFHSSGERTQQLAGLPSGLSFVCTSTDIMASSAPSGWRNSDFFDMYAHNMVRVSLIVPHVQLGDPARNAMEIERLYQDACDAGSALCVFPELCVTGYALDDLLQQDVILEETLEALTKLKKSTLKGRGVLVVGGPLRFDGRLYNCAVVLSRGRTLGIVPKSYLPNFREFYEARQFVPGSCSLEEEVDFLGERGVRFSSETVFQCEQNGDFCFGIEICQDVWVPVPPSTFQAWRGATVLCNLSASNVTMGKADYRRQLVSAASAKNYAAYAYVSAGQGESTNDLAWDGQAVVYESGEPLAESPRFSKGDSILHADVDLDRLVQDRARDMTWSHNASAFKNQIKRIQRVRFAFEACRENPVTRLAFRAVPKRPYVPSDPANLSQLCYECYNVQVSGLVQRIRASCINKLVIGVSGGLDSTHALLVCCKALDDLGLPRTNCLAYTMPGYATGALTKSYALELMSALGVTFSEIDIRPSCDQMLKDLQHPYSRGEKVYDVTFENVQAGERTNHLFRLANMSGAFVVGTGDLSELALGWCTYGVGDHMSHYSVNASLPKSLIQCLIQWCIDSSFFGETANSVLANVLAVEISPELVPDDAGTAKLQSTEAALGPYDLHDFQLYHATRRGFSPSKAFFLACHAWADDMPRDPNARPAEPQPSLGSHAVLTDRTFSVAFIAECQRNFFRRFFLTTQFKRTCIPNAPKVADGASLSPRGDWRAPSDSSWAPWDRAWRKTLSWVSKSHESHALSELLDKYPSQ